MSKKIFIIIISLTLGILLVGLIGYYFLIQNNNTPNNTTTGFKNFFPFGGQNTPIQTAMTTSNPPTTPEQLNFNQKLRQLSVEPVAGAGILDVKRATTTGSVVRYIEKATGHIFEVELFSPNQNRISNTTIPLVSDAIFGNKNNSIIARYLKDDNQTVDTFSLTIKNTSTITENNITGIAFPPNINEVSILGDSLFYLQQTDGASLGYTSNFAGTKRVQIWNSPIKELLAQYVNTKTVALTTKPAQNIGGFLYFVDTGSGQTRKILGDILGLSTLTNAVATQVLYLEEGSNANMYVFDTKTKSSTNISPTTFPEKCLWSKLSQNIIYCAVPRENIDGQSLANWYKGFVSFTDDIWKYDVKNNTSTLVENLSDDSAKSIDVIKPILSEKEQYLVFINKIDNSLWSLDLTK